MTRLIIITVFYFISVPNIFSQKSLCQFDINEKEMNSLEEKISQLKIDTSNQLYIIGEDHAYASENLSFELLFFNFLQKQFPRVDYIQETNHAEAFLINRFLEANDSSIFLLYTSLDCYYLTQLDFIKKLYDTSINKFKFIGIDIHNETLSGTSMLALNEIIKYKKCREYKNKLPSELKELFNLLDRQMNNWVVVSKKNNMELLYLYTNIYQKIITTESVKNEYERIFGEFYPDFFRIIEDFSLGFQYYRLEKEKLKKREQILYKRCKELLESDTTIKYYARFGLHHVQKVKLESDMTDLTYPSMTEELINDGIKVFSGGCVYTYKARNIRPIKLKKFIFWLEKVYRVDNHIIKEVLKYRLNSTNHIIDLQSTNESKMFDFIYVFNVPLAYFKDVN